MTDHLDRETRSWNMSRIRGKDTKPEIAVRKMLHAAGFRFRLHVKDLPGKPDMELMGVAINVERSVRAYLERMANSNTTVIHWASTKQFY